jgi:preprotein translocase subunit Sss1
MSLKKNWDELMEYSLALATGLVLVVGAVGLLLVVGIAVVLSKVMIFIK